MYVDVFNQLPRVVKHTHTHAHTHTHTHTDAPPYNDTAWQKILLNTSLPSKAGFGLRGKSWSKIPPAIIMNLLVRAEVFPRSHRYPFSRLFSGFSHTVFEFLE